MSIIEQLTILKAEFNYLKSISNKLHIDYNELHVVNNKLHIENSKLLAENSKLIAENSELKYNKIISIGGIIDIIQRYTYSNMSINEIANYYNISSDKILNILKDNNIINKSSESKCFLKYIQNNNKNYISDDELSLSSSSSDNNSC